MSNLICRTLHHHFRSATRSSQTNSYRFLQIRPFSSSPLTSIETNPNQQSFTVNYLINSCGFPLEKAVSASRRINLKTPEYANSVLAFFESHGFSKTQIANIIRNDPRVLVQKTLLPKLEFLKSKGASSTDIAVILSSSWNTMLHCSLEKRIIPSVSFLKSLLTSDEKVISAVKRCPRLLLSSIQTYIPPKVEILRVAGVPNAYIFSLLSNQPRSFLASNERFKQTVEDVGKMGFDPSKSHFVNAVRALTQMAKSTWRKKVEIYKKWGWSEDEILVAFAKHPGCMMLSEENIMTTMDFLVNKTGLKSSSLAKRPLLVALSLEKRIVPRFAVYQALMSKGFIKNNDMRLIEMLKYPEKQFLEKLVNCYGEGDPELLKLYKEKLALSK